jgi:predicted ester cyclase
MNRRTDQVAVAAHNGDELASGAEGGVAEYHSIISKAVGELDLNTEQARRRLYERARAALHSEMQTAYPPFRRFEIAAQEMSLKMAIEAVEAEAVRKQNAKLAMLAGSFLRANVSLTPGSPVRQNGRLRDSLATLWTRFCRRADDRARGRDGNPDRGIYSKGHTWLTELLASAFRQTGRLRDSLTTLWTRFCHRADDGAPGRDANPGHTWLTELLASAFRQTGRLRDSLTTLWTRFCHRADDGAPGRDANPGHTWLTEFLASALRQNGRLRDSLTTLWGRFCHRADDGAPGRDGNLDHGIDTKGHTWLTELLASASRGLDNEGQDFTPKWISAQNGDTKRQHASARKRMAGLSTRPGGVSWRDGPVAVTWNRVDVMSARGLGYTLSVTGAAISGRGCSIERRVKSIEEIIRLQRATVDEDIGQENAHNRPAVYDTLTPHESAIDVIPAHAQFGGLNGIGDFLQAVDAAFPDFEANVWSEYDSPGCSVREIAVQGTHKGEWCGVAGTGKRVKFNACMLYLFGKDDPSGKLLAKRFYFDNETVMKQINGQAEAASVPEFGDHQIALAK